MMNDFAGPADEHKLSGNARWIASLGITDKFQAGWRTPKIFSDRALFRLFFVMFLHSAITGVFLFLHARGVIADPRIKNLYAISLFLTILGGGLYALGLLNAKRAAAIIMSMVAAVSWEYVFYNSYILLSPIFFIGCSAVIYWALADPRLAQAIGLRRDKLPYALTISAAIALAGFVYVCALLSAFGYALEFDFWKNLSHASIISSQNLLVFCMVFAAWRRLNDSGLSDSASIVVVLISLLALQLPVVIGYSLGSDFGFVKTVSAQFVMTFVLTAVAHYTFKAYKSVLPLVFVMTAMQEAALMAGLL